MGATGAGAGVEVAADEREDLGWAGGLRLLLPPFFLRFMLGYRGAVAREACCGCVRRG